MSKKRVLQQEKSRNIIVAFLEGDKNEKNQGRIDTLFRKVPCDRPLLRKRIYISPLTIRHWKNQLIQTQTLAIHSSSMSTWHPMPEYRHVLPRMMFVIPQAAVLPTLLRCCHLSVYRTQRCQMSVCATSYRVPKRPYPSID